MQLCAARLPWSASHPPLLATNPPPSSLRAKLTHAFDLLRTYQHKVRVLDATVAVTGAPSVHSSRPVSPAGYSGGGPAPAAACLGVDPQLLATQLDALGGGPSSIQCAMLSTPQRHGDGGQCRAAGAACGAGCQLSPVAEGGAEGVSPARAPRSAPAAGQHSPGSGMLPAADSSLQLVSSGTASLPQLETLKMLAQALLEAQAEVSAKQQRREQWGAAAAQPPSGHAALAGGPQLPAPAATPQPAQLPSVVPPHAQLVFDASVGPCGGFLISQQPAATCSSGGLGGGSSGTARMDAQSCSSSPAGDVHRQPLVAVQQQQQQCSSMRGAGGSSAWAGDGAHQGCLLAIPPPLEFADDLLELVHDVENIDGRHAGQDWSSSRAATACAGGPWGEHASDALYEENDVLSLLEQL